MVHSWWDELVGGGVMSWGESGCDDLGGRIGLLQFWVCKSFCSFFFFMSWWYDWVGVVGGR